MASEYKYGSVSNDEEAAGTKTFDETDLYYMKEGERTRKEKIMTAIKLGVPIMIASILIVGLGYLLLHNFGYFYPGQGGTSSKRSSVTTISSTPATTTHSSHYDNIATKVPITTTTFGASSCAANPKCADRGLTGECCPSPDGTKLDCCA